MMPDLQLHIKPCPYCGRPASIEISMYDTDGTFITDQKNRTLWLAKCSECGARTEYHRTRLSAIIAWNRAQFTKRSVYLESAPYTTDMTAWVKLRDDIILAQTSILEQAALGREIRRAAGGRCESELQGESWFYSAGYKRLMGPDGDEVVKGIKLKAKYDYWKYQMNCRHCAVKEGSCPHKADNSLWRQFLRGTAPGCPRREGDDWK